MREGERMNEGDEEEGKERERYNVKRRKKRGGGRGERYNVKRRKERGD